MRATRSLRATARATAAIVVAIALNSCGDDLQPRPTTPPPAAPVPVSVPIRRLTNAEYVASTADLFPGYTLPLLNFVPDTKTLGFVNLSSSQTSSLVRMEQYEKAAQDIATLVVADPAKLTGCAPTDATGERACAESYLFGLAKRAYRRPPSEREKQAIADLFALDPESLDYRGRLRLGVQAILLSPKFIFRPEVGVPNAGAAQVALTSHEVATRLSYLITGSLPDAELTAAADENALLSPDEIRRQAERLLALPRAQANVVGFHQLWLGIDTISAISKKAATFPTFTPALAAYMGQETRTFLGQVIFAQAGTFADLFLAPYSFVNGPLASFYGVSAPAKDWDRVEMNPKQRTGLLTHASLLATMAKEDRTDPVRRGKFVLERLLCRHIPPPSPEIVAMFKPLDLSKTAREQFTQHRANSVCAACHNFLDPLGLPFEHYDALGQWRDDDRGIAIDATGSIDKQPFDGIPELAKLLVEKPEARACYVAQWFRFAMGRLNDEADKSVINWMAAQLTNDKRIVDLVVDLVQSESFRTLKTEDATGGVL